ncbi:uncharacterized protein scaf isoform X2 [Atheta coriaria]|uniref:uncharacterized protein scaf isoform X2 n=1 Tax=Dalotia coriaria TaxID=877792 RepID=UPI0031F40D13
MPLVLIGIIAAAALGLCAGDVSHLAQTQHGGGFNEAARAINTLAAVEQPNEPFWWMDRDSPLGRATADYHHGAASAKSHSLAANPFLNGQVHVSDVPSSHGPQKLDLSNNPFFNGGISGGLHAGADKTECRGDGYICVRRSECRDGVINNDGFGLIQVRSQVSLCNAKTEVCCRYKDHEFVTGGKSSVHKAPVLDVTNLGETGADLNRLGGSSGSSTSKPTRDAPFVGSTIDYSNTHFGDDVRFASTIRGPAYLPPVDATKPPVTQPPVIEPPSCRPNEYLAGGRCVPRPTPPPPITCAYGEQLINGRCVPRPTPPPPPRCLPNEYLANGQCVARPTPPPPPRCNFNEQLVNGRCVPKPTPPPPVTQPTYLPPSPTCGPNEFFQNGRCVSRPTQPPPPITCPPGQQLIGGRCQCAGNTILQNGRCVSPPPPPPSCAYNEQLINGRCVPKATPPPPPPSCAYNEQLINGRCVPRPTPPPPPPSCAYNEQLVNGRCVPRPTPPPPPPSCGYNEQLINGRCVPKPTPPPPPSCGFNEQLVNGRCVPRPTPPPPPPSCAYNEQLINGRCVPRPTPPPPPPSCGYNEQLINGRCVPKPTPPPQPSCAYNEQLINGRCVPRATPPPPTTSKPTYLPPATSCGPNQYEQNGQCFTRPTAPPPPPPPRCNYNEELVNGRCIPKPTPRPPPPPPPSCGYNEQLVNGRCVPKPPPPPPPPSCSYNEQLVNGRCVPKPTPPPPTPRCQGGQQLVGGVCQCVGNTVYQNGRCITPTEETRNPCTGSQFLQNGQCVSCRPNEFLQNGRCVPRATPPPPTTPSAYLPPVTCGYDQILQGGRCVQRPTTAPPLICTGNTYLQNGVCVPRPTTPPVRPTTAPGYVYPKPTPTFSLPTIDGADTSVNNIYVRTSTTTEKADNVPSGDNNNPTIIRPRPPSSDPVLPGCAAALKCVQEIYCTAEGFVSPVPVVFTKEQEFSRVPLTDCADQEAGIVGKCCRDADYKDPWPSANLVNGIDNGQYREDPSLGQYTADVRNNRLTRSNAVQEQAQVFQPQQPQCGTRHFDAQPRGPGALDANFAEIPWQAMILRDSNRSLLCGGAIIRKNAVITSAHCVEGLEASDVLIKGGEWKLGIDEEPLPFQIVKVRRIVVHPLYNRESLQHDVAILQLEEKLRFTKNIGSICLPAPGQQPTGRCIVTGWGKKVLQIHLKDAIMRTIDVDLVNQNECSASMQTNFPDLVNRLGAETYCAASKADQCKVDHGSALACTDDGEHYTLHGVFSWDTGCKDERQLGAYVQPDLEWIEAALTPKGRRY